MRVLVADDSGVMRKIIIRALNSMGVHDILEAADGQVAVDNFPGSRADLVLTDWNMPGKSGLEVIQEIRAGGSDVPIIMITTESEKRRVMAAIEAGVTDYLVKPFEAEALREKIEKHVATLA